MAMGKHMSESLEFVRVLWPLVAAFATVALSSVATWVSMRKDVAEALRLAREGREQHEGLAVKVATIETRQEDMLSTLIYIRKNMLTSQRSGQ